MPLIPLLRRSSAAAAVLLLALGMGSCGEGPTEPKVSNATQLVFLEHPSSAIAGEAISPAVRVAVLDAKGKSVATATSVTLAIGANPGGSTLGGTVTVSSVGGVATFAGLTLNKVGVSYTLTASSTGLSSATSDPFHITPGAAAALAFSVQPTSTSAGAQIAPAIQVRVQDAHGNPVTGSTPSITLALGANTAGGTLAGTMTVSAISGVATFSNLSIAMAGTGYTLTASATGLAGATSTAFNIVAGAPAALQFTAQPGSGAAGATLAPPVRVSLRDVHGNLATTATSVTLTLGANPGGSVLGGTTTVTAAAGEATFGDLTLNKAGTGYTLVANATGLTAATSATFDIAAGAASQLVFNVQPADGTAGASLAPAVQVTVQDAAGNTVTGATHSITIALGANPGAGTLGGTATATAVNGVATFANLSINRTGSGYTLAASATGLTGATSASFAITPAASARLAFVVQPSDAVAGTAIAPSVRVVILDALGNQVTGATNAVTIDLAANPGAGVLAGTTVSAGAGGIAEFNDLRIERAASGYALSATAAGLTGATSASFDITPAAAAQLAFSVQPVTVAAGAAITPPVQLSVQDAFGNVVLGATNTIGVAIANNPAGGVLSGTASVAAVSGVASFPTLEIDVVGNGYTLAASTPGLTGTTSAAFNVVPSAPARVEFIAQPTDATAGIVIAPAVQVAVTDASGNVIPGATNDVSLTFATNPDGGVLGGTLTVAAVNGVATFTDLRIARASASYSLRASAAGLASDTSEVFSIVPAPALRLLFQREPGDGTAGVALAPSIQVVVQDSLGNRVMDATTAITLSLAANPGGSTLAGTTSRNAIAGVAEFDDMVLERSGAGYLLDATASGLTTATSVAFNIVAGAASQLAFVVQPSDVTMAAVIAPPVQVQVRDAFGNNTNTSTTITVAIGANPGGGSLAGGVSVGTTSGLAAFSDLSIDAAGTGYTLVASAVGVTSATSEAFDVAAGAADRLVFVVQPTESTAGDAITPAIQVAVQDAAGNTVVGATTSITLALGSNPWGGVLGGTTTVAAVSGVATFTDISVDRSGLDYTLVATASGLAGAASAVFTVDGGSLINGYEHQGRISPVADTDTWTFVAAAGEYFAVAMGEVVPGATLSPWIRVYAPGGAQVASSSGTAAAQVSGTAGTAGTYTVVAAGVSGSGAYRISVASAPRALSISAGDEGGAMTSGTTYLGTISTGDMDAYTIEAPAGGRIVVNMGEVVAGATLYPWVRIVGPTGTVLGTFVGTAAAHEAVTAPTAGTYTILAADGNSHPSGTGEYRLTAVVAPATQVISAGDEGGPMTSGTTYLGTITTGDLDAYTIDAPAGASIIVNMGDVVDGATLYPWVRIVGPTGTVLGTFVGTGAAHEAVTAPTAGTYTILAADGNSHPSGTGEYRLTAVVAPATQVISAGDEGGPMTSGTTYLGTITTGDLDAYTIDAPAGASIVVNMGEVVAGATLYPWVRVVGPTGTVLGTFVGTGAAHEIVTAPTAGAYTILAADGNSHPSGTGEYRLTVVVAPGTQVISAGDEGGPMTSGTTYLGTISTGDMDAYTIEAPAGGRIVVNMGEVVAGATLYPWVRIVGPTGTVLGTFVGTAAAHEAVTAPTAGTYTILAADGNSHPSGTGDYRLTAAVAPATQVISAGDEGGPMTSGTTYLGTITTGDLDAYTIEAPAGATIAVHLGEIVSGATLYPWVRIVGPTGTVLGTNVGTAAGYATVTAPTAGTYTILVVDGNSHPSGTGEYRLTAVVAPGTQVISAGDEGGPMTSGTPYAGALTIGDLDVYTFTASAGDNIVVTLSELVSGSALTPWIRIIGPNGTMLNSIAGSATAQVSRALPTTGTYTILVSDGASHPSGIGNYQLTLQLNP